MPTPHRGEAHPRVSATRGFWAVWARADAPCALGTRKGAVPSVLPSSAPLLSAGFEPPPHHPTSPHNPLTLFWQAIARDGRAGAGGQSPSPGVWATGEGPPNPTPRPWAAQPPMHIGAGRRSFRRTPSNAAALTALGRAPHDGPSSGSVLAWVRRPVECGGFTRQSLVWSGQSGVRVRADYLFRPVP